jgi:hypothetical protein
MSERVWDFKDWAGKDIPKPVHWDDHPEWFGDDGHALRLAGPRFLAPDDHTWTWGPTEKIHELGEYVILHFRWDDSRHPFGSQTRHGEEGFIAWVDGSEVDGVRSSLDECLVDMIRFKYEGRRGSSGPRATEYFMKMIGAESLG